MRALFVLLGIGFLFGCSKKEETVQKNGPAPVVLIFDKINTQPEDDTLHRITFVDKDLLLRNLLVSKQVGDTIVITTGRRQLEVQRISNRFDKLSYFFRPGDTVVFFEKDSEIKARLHNRNESFFITNLNAELFKISTSPQRPYTALTRYHNFLDFLPPGPESLEEKLEKHFREVKNTSKEEVQVQTSMLDSLKRAKLLAEDAYDFFKKRIVTAHLRIQLDTPNAYFVRQPFDKKWYDKTTKAVTQLHHDSLLQYPFYRDFVLWVYTFETRNVPRKFGPNGDTEDFQAMYDSLKSRSDYTHDFRKVLLSHAVEGLVFQLPPDDMKTYRDDFVAFVNDSAFSQGILGKYKLDEAVSSDLILHSLEKKSLTLNELLLANRGKVIYVDFWASWCAPCVRSLPASAELRNRYRPEPVVFVYLSIDEEKERWIQAAQKHGLDTLRNNFIVHNQFTSTFMEEMGIGPIPRYLIYDKNGTLVRRSAPPPEGTEINTLLDELLAR